MRPTQRKAMEQALDFIRAVNSADNDSGFLNPNLCYSLYECETALVTALAEPAPEPAPEPVAHLWQHGETGRTRVVMPDSVTDCDARWQLIGPLYLAAPAREPAPAPKQAEPYVD